jgi:hypothetical protein
MGLRFKTTGFAQGRHIADPSIKKPEDMLQYSYFVWVVDLRIPACTQILQDLHGHRLDLYSYGHSVQLHTAIDGPVELCTS